MSAEFTPESERQRLQFLVGLNFSQLTCTSPVPLSSPLFPSHVDATLVFHTLHVELFVLPCSDIKTFFLFAL